MPASLAKFHVPPERLLICAPVCTINGKVSVKVAVPLLFKVRVTRNGSKDMVMPPLALVTPVPLIVPPAQVNRPVILSVPVPVSVPPDIVRVGKVTAAPVAKVVVPDEMFVGAVRLEPELKFTVVALNSAVPAPETEAPELKLNG